MAAKAAAQGAADGLSDDEEYAIRELVGAAPLSEDDSGGPFRTPPRVRNSNNNNNNTMSNGSHRRVVGFRSSILRDLAQPSTHAAEDGDDGGDDMRMTGASLDEAAKQRRLQLHLSNEDIRASPRLLGYLFGSIGTTCYG